MLDLEDSELISDSLKSLRDSEKVGFVCVIGKGKCAIFSLIETEVFKEVVENIAFNLSKYPLNSSDIAEGCHISYTDNRDDDLSLGIGVQVPVDYSCIVCVLGDELGDEDDSVFCMGDSMELTYLALRASTCSFTEDDYFSDGEEVDISK